MVSTHMPAFTLWQVWQIYGSSPWSYAMQPAGLWEVGGMASGGQGRAYSKTCGPGGHGHRCQMRKQDCKTALGSPVATWHAATRVPLPQQAVAWPVAACPAAAAVTATATEASMVTTVVAVATATCSGPDPAHKESRSSVGSQVRPSLPYSK